MILSKLCLVSISLLALAAGSCNETLAGDKDSGYRGCQTKTRNGRTCMKWTEQKPHAHKNTPTEKPKAGLGDHNFCRNPDGWSKVTWSSAPSGSTIWCFTTDPLIRWDYCDPVVPGYSVTHCETHECQPHFARLNSSGLRTECAFSRDPRVWPGFDDCCPVMMPLGMCALAKCGGSKLYSSQGTDVGLGFFFKLAGILCSCQAEGCSGVVQVVKHLMHEEESALSVIADMHSRGMKHPLMPHVCSPAGLQCLETKPGCKQLSILRGHDIKVALGLVEGVASIVCPKSTTTSTTTSAQSGEQLKAVVPFVSAVSRYQFIVALGVVISVCRT